MSTVRHNVCTRAVAPEKSGMHAMHMRPALALRDFLVSCHVKESTERCISPIPPWDSEHNRQHHARHARSWRLVGGHVYITGAREAHEYCDNNDQTGMWTYNRRSQTKP